MTDFFDFSKLRRYLSRYTHLLKPGLIALSVLLVFTLIYSFKSPLTFFFRKLLVGPSTLISFAKDPLSTLASSSDRTNLLLLGRGGEGHIGADLTDSIIVISFHHPTKKVSILSLPRDIWVDSMKAKINTAYYYGKQKKPAGGGLILAKSSVSEIIGLPIHYAFVLDFEGFKQAIDLVGGIDVQIERTFDDFKYPVPGKEDALPESDRYQFLHFDAGPNHMDGETALRFVRSRMAEGEEGTDFARSARQQKVILAFKDKLLSSKTLLSPQRLADLFNLYRQYIDTDITNNEYAAFTRLVLAKDLSIKNVPLTTGDKEKGELGVLENPKNKTPYLGQYVLIARDNNWEALKQYIQNELAR